VLLYELIFDVKHLPPRNLLLQELSFEVIFLVLSTHWCTPVLYQNAFESLNWFQLDYDRDNVVYRSTVVFFARHEGLWRSGNVHNPS